MRSRCPTPGLDSGPSACDAGRFPTLAAWYASLQRHFGTQRAARVLAFNRGRAAGSTVGCAGGSRGRTPRARVGVSRPEAGNARDPDLARVDVACRDRAPLARGIALPIRGAALETLVGHGGAGLCRSRDDGDLQDGGRRRAHVPRAEWGCDHVSTRPVDEWRWGKPVSPAAGR